MLSPLQDGGRDVVTLWRPSACGGILVARLPSVNFITDLRAVGPDRPFFLYFCPGAGHAPHHVEPEWIERYRGQFDKGWDRWREEVFARQLAARWTG